MSCTTWNLKDVWEREARWTEGQTDPTYIYIYVYSAYIHVYMPIYVSTCAHLYACMCVLVDRCVIYIYVHMYLSIHVHMCNCIIHTLVWHITHIYMHVFTWMCIIHVHTCMYIADIYHTRVQYPHNIHTISTHIQYACTHMHIIYTHVCECLAAAATAKSFSCVQLCATP